MHTNTHTHTHTHTHTLKWTPFANLSDSVLVEDKSGGMNVACLRCISSPCAVFITQHSVLFANLPFAAIVWNVSGVITVGICVCVCVCVCVRTPENSQS